MSLRPRLAAIAARQGGVFSRRQAMLAGYRGPEIRQLTGRGAGAWIVVRRGVYADREIWDAAAASYDGQMRLRDRAAHVALGVDHVLSHDSAARAWGLPMLNPQRWLVHITRPRAVAGSRTEHGIKHHLAPLREGTTRSADGLPVTGLARTAVDIGREHGYAAGLVVADAVLRAGVPRSELRAEVEQMTCWPHVTDVRPLVEDADEGADNAAETLGRALVAELGLGLPILTQFPVRTDRGTYWCDLVVGCHVIEVDGRQKYVARARGGVADKSAEQVVWDEKLRQGSIASEGLGVSRLIWADYWGTARSAALDRLAREYAVTSRRFGDRLPESMIRFAESMAAERQRRIFGDSGRRAN